MQSCLERARQSHEDVTSLQIAASQVLEMKDSQGSKVKALKKRGLFVPTDARFDHAALLCANKVTDLYSTLVSFYRDVDGVRTEYIRYLGGLPCANPSPSEKQMDEETLANTDIQNVVVLRFYDCLKRLKESYSHQSGAHQGQIGGGANILTEVYDPPKHFARWALVETQDTASVLNDARAASQMIGSNEMGPSLTEAINDVLTHSRDKGHCNMFTVGEAHGTIMDLEAIYRQWCNITKYRGYKEKAHRTDTELRIKRQHTARLQKLQVAADDALREETGDDSLTAPLVKIEPIDWNSPVIKRRLVYQELDLVGFLRSFSEFNKIPRWCKYRVKEYNDYLESLLDYLWSFLARRNPMKDLSDIETQMATAFLSRWEERSLPGWHTPTYQDPLYAIATDTLFSTQVALDGHLKSKKHTKAGARLATMNHEEIDALRKESDAQDEDLAWKEAQIERLKEILDEPLTSTIEDLQKRQSRTQEDLVEEEFSEEESQGDNDNEGSDSGDSEDKAIYNPLNLPLGFDGKPIPYWLYKLHGLGTEYKCEICGNYSYWGRRAFEKHFSEWRHAFGMRCLRIPNTPHFREVTSIQDALRLYERLVNDSQISTFNAEEELEVEDEEGNVMTLRDFRARKGEAAKY